MGLYSWSIRRTEDRGWVSVSVPSLSCALHLFCRTPSASTVAQWVCRKTRRQESHQHRAPSHSHRTTNLQPAEVGHCARRAWSAEGHSSCRDEQERNAAQGWQDGHPSFIHHAIPLHLTRGAFSRGESWLVTSQLCSCR